VIANQPSIFTPSNSPEKLLEDIFVQREKLLGTIVRRVEESLLTTANYHPIFIGPRGCGKTHFLTMVVNRLKKRPKLKKKMVIAWLGEDDIVTSYLDFMLSILEKLQQADPEYFNVDCLSRLDRLDENEKSSVIAESITEQLGDKTILLVKENLSDVFKGLAEIGQHKLRAFLQENNNMVMLTSTQLLFEGVKSREKAFFGFFDMNHLKPLTIQEAKQLLIKLAELKGDNELVEFLNTPKGGYRMRSLHYLAGGNHRLYISLSAYLNKKSLDELVNALVKLVGELTPYFQERIRALPPQQGKIIQKMCEIQGALPVKEIAKRTVTIGEKSLAKQLGDLEKMKYVIKHKRGRQAYYEIAEPLMRLSLEVKNSHGKPLRVLLQLLRAWFSDDQLNTSLLSCSSSLQEAYLKGALEADRGILDETSLKLYDEIKLAKDENDFQKAIKIFDELIALLSVNNDSHKIMMAKLQQASLYFKEGDFEHSIDILLAINSSEVDEFKVLTLLMFNYLISGQYKDLLTTCLKLEKDFKLLTAPEVMHDYNVMIAYSHSMLGNFSLAIKALEKCFKYDGIESELAEDLLSRLVENICLNSSNKWSDYIDQITEIYIKNDHVEVLMHGMTKSIKSFSEDQNLQPLISIWFEAWQNQVQKHEEMEFPVILLESLVASIIQKSDKPLLALPKELRELFLPLIKDILIE